MSTFPCTENNTIREEKYSDIPEDVGWQDSIGYRALAEEYSRPYCSLKTSIVTDTESSNDLSVIQDYDPICCNDGTRSIQCDSSKDHLSGRLLSATSVLFQPISVTVRNFSEPIFMSVVLFSISNDSIERLSESMMYNLISNDISKEFDFIFNGINRHPITDACIFRVPEISPSSSIVVVINYFKILSSSSEKALQSYQKSSPLSSKSDGKSAEDMERLGDYRQNIGVSAFILFDKQGRCGQNGGPVISLPVFPLKQSINENQLAEFLRSNILPEIDTRKIETLDIDTKVCVVDLEKSQAFWKLEKRAIQLLQDSNNRLSTGSIDRSLARYSCYKVVPSHIYFSRQTKSEELSCQRFPDISASSFYVDGVLDESSSFVSEECLIVVEMRCFSEKDSMNVQFDDFLYLYPLAIENFQHRNLALKVELIEIDVDRLDGLTDLSVISTLPQRSLANICLPVSGKTCSDSMFTTVSYHCKMPLLLDEIKISLPVIISKRMFFKFTVQHVHVKPKNEKRSSIINLIRSTSSVDEPCCDDIGVSYLPLMTDDGITIQSDVEYIVYFANYLPETNTDTPIQKKRKSIDQATLSGSNQPIPSKEITPLIRLKMKVFSTFAASTPHIRDIFTNFPSLKLKQNQFSDKCSEATLRSSVNQDTFQYLEVIIKLMMDIVVNSSIYEFRKYFMLFMKFIARIITKYRVDMITRSGEVPYFAFLMLLKMLSSVCSEPEYFHSHANSHSRWENQLLAYATHIFLEENIEDLEGLEEEKDMFWVPYSSVSSFIPSDSSSPLYCNKVCFDNESIDDGVLDMICNFCERVVVEDIVSDLMERSCMLCVDNLSNVSNSDCLLPMFSKSTDIRHQFPRWKSRKLFGEDFDRLSHKSFDIEKASYYLKEDQFQWKPVCEAKERISEDSRSAFLMKELVRKNYVRYSSSSFFGDALLGIWIQFWNYCQGNSDTGRFSKILELIDPNLVMQLRKASSDHAYFLLQILLKSFGTRMMDYETPIFLDKKTLLRFNELFFNIVPFEIAHPSLGQWRSQRLNMSLAHFTKNLFSLVAPSHVSWLMTQYLDKLRSVSKLESLEMCLEFVSVVCHSEQFFNINFPIFRDATVQLLHQYYNSTRQQSISGSFSNLSSLVMFSSWRFTGRICQLPTPAWLVILFVEEVFFAFCTGDHHIQKKAAASIRSLFSSIQQTGFVSNNSSLHSLFLRYFVSIPYFSDAIASLGSDSSARKDFLIGFLLLLEKLPQELIRYSLRVKCMEESCMIVSNTTFEKYSTVQYADILPTVLGGFPGVSPQSPKASSSYWQQFIRVLHSVLDSFVINMLFLNTSTRFSSYLVPDLIVYSSKESTDGSKSITSVVDLPTSSTTSKVAMLDQYLTKKVASSKKEKQSSPPSFSNSSVLEKRDVTSVLVELKAKKMSQQTSILVLHCARMLMKEYEYCLHISQKEHSRIADLDRLLSLCLGLIFHVLAMTTSFEVIEILVEIFSELLDIYGYSLVSHAMRPFEDIWWDMCIFQMFSNESESCRRGIGTLFARYSIACIFTEGSIVKFQVLFVSCFMHFFTNSKQRSNISYAIMIKNFNELIEHLDENLESLFGSATFQKVDNGVSRAVKLVRRYFHSLKIIADGYSALLDSIQLVPSIENLFNGIKLTAASLRPSNSSLWKSNIQLFRLRLDDTIVKIMMAADQTDPLILSMYHIYWLEVASVLYEMVESYGEAAEVNWKMYQVYKSFDPYFDKIFRNRISFVYKPWKDFFHSLEELTDSPRSTQWKNREVADKFANTTLLRCINFSSKVFHYSMMEKALHELVERYRSSGDFALIPTVYAELGSSFADKNRKSLTDISIGSFYRILFLGTGRFLQIFLLFPLLLLMLS